MRMGYAKIGQEAVAEASRDVAAVTLDVLAANLAIAPQHAKKVFGVEALAKRRRVDDVDEDHGKLPSLGRSRHEPPHAPMPRKPLHKVAAFCLAKPHRQTRQ